MFDVDRTNDATCSTHCGWLQALGIVPGVVLPAAPTKAAAAAADDASPASQEATAAAPTSLYVQTMQKQVEVGAMYQPGVIVPTHCVVERVGIAVVLRTALKGRAARARGLFPKLT